MAQVESHEATDYHILLFLKLLAQANVFLQPHHVQEAEGNRGGGQTDPYSHCQLGQMQTEEMPTGVQEKLSGGSHGKALH
jgi:hypothetical protein